MREDVKCPVAAVDQVQELLGEAELLEVLAQIDSAVAAPVVRDAAL